MIDGRKPHSTRARLISLRKPPLKPVSTGASEGKKQTIKQVNKTARKSARISSFRRDPQRRNGLTRYSNSRPGEGTDRSKTLRILRLKISGRSRLGVRKDAFAPCCAVLCDSLALRFESSRQDPFCSRSSPDSSMAGVWWAPLALCACSGLDFIVSASRYFSFLSARI